MAKAVGIDLGTTNSVIAAMEGGQPTVIPNAEGSRTTPSVVAFTDSGERLVGQLARRQAILNPKGTIYSAKRFIGRRFDEVDQRAERGHVRRGRRARTARCGSRSTTSCTRRRRSPRWCCASSSTTRRSSSARRSPRRSSPCPAYFNDAQRQATKDAGRIAGLEVLRIINEPTAAALAYGLDKKGNETVLVFDLGGGTFDVSILDVGDGVVEVRATSGDTHLGGDDFDRRIVDHLADEFQRDNGIDLRQDPQALQRLFEAAEKAKVELSSVTQTQINLPFITADATGPKHLNTTLMRSTFEEITADLVERCLGPVAAGDGRRQGHRRRHRRGDPGRRLDPDPGRAGPGAPADRRQGPEHDGQPGRGRRARRRDPGRGHQGRGEGRRCCSTSPRCRWASRPSAGS